MGDGDAQVDAAERFDAAEYRRRRAAVERLVDEAGADALVIFGNQASTADILYLSGWAPGWDSYFIAGGSRPPALRVPSPNHLPTAERLSVVQDVAWSGPDPVGGVVADLQSRGRLRTVALLGPFPWQVHARLTEALGEEVRLVDLGLAFKQHRLIKSEAEIAWTRQAAALCDAGISALVAEARPGLREHELGAAVESAYRRLGGQHGICFLCSGPMTGGGPFVPAQQWTRRELKAGDAVTIELSAGIGGYSGQVLRSVAVGGDPPPEYRRLHDVAAEAFAAIFAAIRPGATAADLQAAAAVIDRAGCSVCDDVVHGYGGGYLPPVIRTPATAHRAPPDLVLQPGMMLVIQPNVVTPDRRLGVQTGELVVVTDAGAESLHRAPRGLLRGGTLDGR
jgi:Xaa-Pro aminopeptidase